MKKIILFVLVASVFIISCNGGSGNNNNSTPDTVLAKFISNWVDTPMYAYISDPIGKDTMYAGHSADTSYVIYHGQKMYIWWQSHGVFNQVWGDNLQAYAVYTWIGITPFDTASAYSQILVYPQKYKDANGNLVNNGNGETIVIYNLHHFDSTATNSMYSSIFNH